MIVFPFLSSFPTCSSKGKRNKRTTRITNNLLAPLCATRTRHAHPLLLETAQCATHTMRMYLPLFATFGIESTVQAFKGPFCGVREAFTWASLHELWESCIINCTPARSWTTKPGVVNDLPGMRGIPNIWCPESRAKAQDAARNGPDGGKLPRHIGPWPNVSYHIACTAFPKRVARKYNSVV